MTRLELYELLSNQTLLNKANTVAARKKMSEYVSGKMAEYVSGKMADYLEEDIVKKISLFSFKILSRWKASGRNKNNF